MGLSLWILFQVLGFGFKFQGLGLQLGVLVSVELSYGFKCLGCMLAWISSFFLWAVASGRAGISLGSWVYFSPYIAKSSYSIQALFKSDQHLGQEGLVPLLRYPLSAP